MRKLNDQRKIDFQTQNFEFWVKGRAFKKIQISILRILLIYEQRRHLILTV